MVSKTARHRLLREVRAPLLVVAIIVGLTTLAVWITGRMPVTRVEEQQQASVVPPGSGIRVRLQDVPLGEFRLFRYEFENGSNRLILVQRGMDDKPRVAFTSCRTCDAGDATSYVRGDRLYCRRCKTPMHIPETSHVRDAKTGACDAVPIQYERRGDEIVVEPRAIEERAAIFLTGNR